MVAPELNLTKKVTADKEGAGTPIAKDCGRKSSRGDSTFCQQMLRLTDTLKFVRVVLCLHRMEERQNHFMTNAENESARSSRES